MARKSRKQPLSNSPQFPLVVASRCYNAAAYIRLSCDDTKKRGDSLETQRNIIENFIAASPDIELTGIYSDNNATGTNFDRPGFQKMLADVESGLVNCIIVKDLTRFGRNAIDVGYYLERTLPALGVRFIAVTDSFDSLNGDGGIMLPLKNLIGEAYALDIGRKVRAVHQQNIADGRFVGRLAPYGYMKEPKDCHRLIPDPETAPVVRQIFAWAERGIGGNEIARRLTAEKIPSPCRYYVAKGFNRSEKLAGLSYWKGNSVKEILSSPIYLGDMVQGKTRKVNGRQIPVPPSEWVCVENTHEALVSREAFQYIQDLMGKTNERAQVIHAKSVPYSPNLFKGKVLCAKCGRPMHRNRQNKDGIYWFRCESQWRYGEDKCTLVSVKEAELKTEILAMLHKHTEVVLGHYITAKRQSEETADIREVNQGLDKDGRMLKSLYESMVGGLITQDEFTQMKADYEAKIAALFRKADEIRNHNSALKDRAAETTDLADAISEAVCNDELTADIIDRLVEGIYVNPDKSFHVEFKFNEGWSKPTGVDDGERQVPVGAAKPDIRGVAV